MTDDNMYVVISYKWTAGAHLTFWGPNNCGYTENFEKAGRYTEDEIRAHFSYYNSYYENDLIGRAVKVSEIKKRFKIVTRVEQDWLQKKKHLKMNKRGVLHLSDAK